MKNQGRGATSLKSGSPHLRAVPDEPPAEKEPRPDLHDYEHQERNRIAGKNWAAVHVAGDKRSPIDLFHRPGWKGWLR